MKRFSETNKWEDPWFRKMKPKYKAFFQYLCDRCDNAGVWVVDMDLAATYVGEKVDPQDALRVFAGRVVEMAKGKWLIPQFVSFQFGKLSPTCHPHKRIIEAMNRHSLRVGDDGKTTLVTTLPNTPTPTLEDKEEDKDKEEDHLILVAPEPEIDIDALAEEIYQLYPHKVGKPDALAKIRGSLKKYDSIFLREKTKLYAESVAGTDTIMPNPATWFFQERFNDDPKTWVRKQPAPPALTKPTTFDIRQAIQSKEAKMADLKRKHYRDTQGLVGGKYVGAGWQDETAKAEYLKLKEEVKALKTKLEESV